MNYEVDGLVHLAWNQLWQVTVVAIIVASLVGIFGRQRPHLAYLLWMLVIAKCLTPPLWSSPTGLFSWMQVETHQVAVTVPPPVMSDNTTNDSPLATSDETVTPPFVSSDEVERNIPRRADTTAPRHYPSPMLSET